MLPQHLSHGRLSMVKEEEQGVCGGGKGSSRGGAGERQSGTYRDGPLAVFSRRIKAWVKWGSEVSLFLRKAATTRN